MAVKNACDVTIRQVYAGSVAKSTFTFVSSKVAPLTLTDIVDLSTVLISDFLPLLNAVQNVQVANYSMFLQGRGAGVPSYTRPLTGTGGWAALATNQMPPEFAYWLKYGVGETYISINQDPDLFHPIKRGGAFIIGCTDEALDDGKFTMPAGLAAEFSALYAGLVDSYIVGSDTWNPAVLGEQIIEGTGWRYALINAAAVVRITRLRSRLAQ